MVLRFKKINNESGVVLFIVLMTAIVIMIYALGILTQSMNEINYAQQQIDQINCDELKKGLMWQWQSLSAPSNFQPTSPVVYNGRSYTLQMQNYQAGPPAQADFVCSYDTFQ